MRKNLSVKHENELTFELAELEELLASLDSDVRETVYCYVRGRSIDEIACKMNITPCAVNEKLAIAIERLRCVERIV